MGWHHHIDLPFGFDIDVAKANSKKWGSRHDRIKVMPRFLLLRAVPGSMICIPLSLFLPRPYCGYFVLFFAAATPICFVLAIVLHFVAEYVHNRRYSYSSLVGEYNSRISEQQIGLRLANKNDQPVAASAWKPHTEPDWAWGEIQQLLPGDVVVKWGHCIGEMSGAGGYAIKRGDKIVAEYTTWVS